MLVNLVFDYYTDVVDVPEHIGKQLRKYQSKCDKWLYNKLNDHEFWETDNNGRKKYAVGICSEAFVYWLNNVELSTNDPKAKIFEKNLSEYDKSLPTIFY